MKTLRCQTQVGAPPDTVGGRWRCFGNSSVVCAQHIALVSLTDKFGRTSDMCPGCAILGEEGWPN
jgi:hypothetical protein